MIRTALLAFLFLLAACAPPQQAPATQSPAPPSEQIQVSDDQTWVASWAASPGSTNTARDQRYRRIHFRNLTIRQTVRLSAGGEAVRIRLSNELGDRPLNIGAATISLIDPATPDAQTAYLPLTFNDAPSVSIPAGAPTVSDPLPLALGPAATLAINLYVTSNSRTCTCHLTSLATNEISPPGDFTKTPFEPLKTTHQRPFLSGVDVLARTPARTIVAFGDSLTDGMGSTRDANQRWPDLLAERLNQHARDTTWSVVNAGISGNQLLKGHPLPSALDRFDRDVLAQPGVSDFIVFIGVNDLAIGLRNGGGEPTTAQMIAGYRQLLERARVHDLNIYLATIAPFGGAGAYWSEAAETARIEINDWIRNSNEFDGVFDFAAVLADPADPSRLRPAYDSGDRLHASDAGYKALADSIDLSVFAPRSSHHPDSSAR